MALESEIFEFVSNKRNFIFFLKRDLTVFKSSSIDDALTGLKSRFLSNFLMAPIFFSLATIFQSLFAVVNVDLFP